MREDSKKDILKTIMQQLAYICADLYNSNRAEGVHELAPKDFGACYRGHTKVRKFNDDYTKAVENRRINYERERLNKIIADAQEKLERL